MINRLKDFFTSDDNVSFAYLFGSYARGEEDHRSDVDVAVYLKEETFDERLRLIHDLSILVKKDVDLVVLNSSKNLFLAENVLHEGIPLKISKIQDDYELKKWHEILDYKAFRRRLDAA